MGDTPHDDQEHAEQELQNAVLKGAARHALPGFWPWMASFPCWVLAWSFAAIGLWRLGVWGIPILVYFAILAAIVAGYLRSCWKEGDGKTVAEVAATAQSNLVQARVTRWGWEFWTRTTLATAPRTAVGAYGLTAWLPLWAALTSAAAPAVWMVVARLASVAVPSRRVDAAFDLFSERGPEGLPTPEI